MLPAMTGVCLHASICILLYTYHCIVSAGADDDTVDVSGHGTF
jgi:hypothetical protein